MLFATTDTSESNGCSGYWSNTWFCKPGYHQPENGKSQSSLLHTLHTSLHTLLCSSECLLYEWHGTQNVLPSEKFVILSTEIGSSSLRGNLPPFCLRLTITTLVYSDISTPLPCKASHSRWHCNYITISCIPWSSLRGRAHFSPNITPSFLPIRQSFEKHNK